MKEELPKNTNSKDNIEVSKELDEILIEKGIISNDQLLVAKKQMAIKGQGSLGDILVSMGFVTESALGEAISKTSGIKKFDLKSIVLDPRLVKKIPKNVALSNKLIPVSIEPKKITLAIHDIYDVIALDKAKKFFPPSFTIEPVYSPETDILEVIDQYYDYEMSIDGILKEIENAKEGIDNQSENMEEDYKSPIVRLVDSILIDAVHNNASDIHFEPEESFLRLRYRVDGKMRQVKAFHIDYWPPIAVRIKIMSSMNIAESRKPQDGHANANVLGREVDFRVATQPTVHGENIVMRILDKAKSLVNLDQLGYSENNINQLIKLLKKPEGIIVVTGPTGSGKTTTLYSILNYINSVDQNIMTLEDPIEYEIPLIRQTAVSDKGMDFAEGIKSLLRQDPDVIFVGEIRDPDTAAIAIRASMTGHQVFTTLHTNDSIGVISRLKDIGVDSSLLSGSLICCIAQRLVRVLCNDCKIKKKATEQEYNIIGKNNYEEDLYLYKAQGCEKCSNTGYKGRVAISEILSISKEIDEMIALNATSNAIIEQAEKEGFISMAQDGINKVLEGITDIDELIRNVDMTERL